MREIQIKTKHFVAENTIFNFITSCPKMNRPKNASEFGSRQSQRHFIMACQRQGKTATQTVEEVRLAFGDHALSRTQVFEHHRLAADGVTNVADAPRSGRPRSRTNEDKTAVVLRYLQANPSACVRELENACGIHHSSVSRILQRQGYSKICAKWVPRDLTAEHKKARVRYSLENWAIWDELGDQKFKELLITMDETPLPMFNPLTKQQSMQWGPKGSHSCLKAMKSAWTQNVMCTVWFDARGVLLVDYLPQGQTINSDYVVSQLHNVRAAILRKRRIMRQKPFILWDNARPHAAARTQAAVEELGFRQLNHPPYSPDLAIADFHLFGPMKKSMRGEIFTSRQEVITAAGKSLRQFDADFWETGIDKLIERYRKCISLDGEFVERVCHQPSDASNNVSDSDSDW